MSSTKHRKLSLQERVQIETLLNEKKTKAYIANYLNRARSTISREINKCVQDNKTHKYNADLAHWCAKDDYLNKRNLDKISTYKSLRFYVFKGLLNQ